ncbi:hypothetical protein [Streptosporangium sp. NPDC049376]|uniref:hypothetical protein n=1 Tax=Streptosporangium sp. NPDC049376 TaxID=3366192 RepID=UPI003790F299
MVASASARSGKRTRTSSPPNGTDAPLINFLFDGGVLSPAEAALASRPPRGER